MSDDKELEKWAQDYLDLWQDQMSALAADPQAAASLLSMFFGPMAGPQWSGDGKNKGQAGSEDSSERGAAAARASPSLSDMMGAWAAYWPSEAGDLWRQALAMNSPSFAGGGPEKGGQAQGCQDANKGDSGVGPAARKPSKEGSRDEGSSASRSSAAAASSDDGGSELDAVAQRLAALEKRIAALEANFQSNSAGRSGRSRPRRSAARKPASDKT
ncbi:MAG: hypothetical protein AAF530_18245 [Pseudomonadota bacterium]